MSTQTKIFVRNSNGNLVLSNSIVAIQKAAENNNGIHTAEHILSDDQIVEDLTIINGSSRNEELTSLTWLQNTNLLPSMTFSSSGPTESGKSSAGEKKTPMNKSDNLCVRNSSLEENETQSSWDSSNMSYSDTTTVVEGEEESTRAAPVKPPHSFSTLIFLAIESSSSKALPVRDIYIWITKHFAYYCYAPVGWKNSVRHNLSLNKSFCKVERGPNVGKGSLWMVDPLHRPQLLQTLCKVPYMKSEILQQLTNESQSLRAKSEPIQENRRSVVIVTRSPSPSPSPSPPSPSPNRRNMPDPKLFPYLSRRLAFNVDHNHVDGPDADVDAATAMLALGQSHPVFHTNPTKHSLVHPSASPKKHLYANEIPRDEISDSVEETVMVMTTSKTSPAEDHTYSYSPRPPRPLSSETKSKRRLHCRDDSVSEVKVSRTVIVTREKSRGRVRGRGKCR